MSERSPSAAKERAAVVMLSDDEIALLTRVRNVAQDNGSVFPYARPGDTLHLDADDWNRLGKALDRIVQGAPVSAAVSPAEPPASHPEDTCEECGGPNVVWFAPNDVWNRVMRGGDRGAPDAVGIVCPVCFMRRAEALGVKPTGWSVQPEVITADPSVSPAEPPEAEKEEGK